MNSEKFELRINSRIISLMIFSFVINDISAQNWIPLNQENTSNYSTSDLFQDISVIMTDSFKVINTDTVFYLNTILSNYTIPPYNSPLVLPQFLMKTMRNIDNTLYVFRDTSTYVFKIRAALGDSWIFDTTRNLIATVSKITYEPILGLQDSLKYIVLSSLDTIIISKNYGIISMDVPYTELRYKLLGIENLKLGYLVPQYLDFFNFNPGDVFEYKERHELNGRSILKQGFTKLLYQIKILQKTQISDGFIYHVEESKIDSSWIYGEDTKITYYNTFKDIEYKYDSNSFLNYYNNEMFTNFGVQRLYFSYDTLFHINVKKYDVIPLPAQESASYGVGMGLINYYNYQYDFAGGDARIYKNLLGCKIGNHMFGTIHPDWFFTEITTTSDILKVNVFPNPAGDLLIISSNLPINQIHYHIFDINGNLILSDSLSGDSNSIDIAHLKKGLYIIKIFANEEIWTNKFVKL